METKKVKTVVAAIIEKEEKIFAAMRSEGGFMLNKWEFPGGKLEQGETDEEALIRELKEELAITIYDLKYFDHVEYEYETFILKMNAYKCRTNDEVIHVNVHKKVGFFTRDQLLELDFLPADAPLITKLKAEWR
mgnify:FL=1|jgi:8-oxo-dGTP diphosphatase